MEKPVADLECSVARALEIVGERWSLLILRDAFHGIRRFDDFRHDLGIARNVLTERLKKLVDAGVLARRQYEMHPPRYEYVLTQKGRDLLPVLLAMMKWGDRWGGDAPTPKLIHTTCGHVVEPVSACSHCGVELELRELRVEPSPVRRRRPVPAPALA